MKINSLTTVNNDTGKGQVLALVSSGGTGYWSQERIICFEQVKPRVTCPLSSNSTFHGSCLWSQATSEAEFAIWFSKEATQKMLRTHINFTENYMEKTKEVYLTHLLANDPKFFHKYSWCPGISLSAVPLHGLSLPTKGPQLTSCWFLFPWFFFMGISNSSLESIQKTSTPFCPYSPVLIPKLINPGGPVVGRTHS
jgi:hypothetical protein